MRLLSYNIHKGIGGHDRRYSLKRIIDVVEHENPDLMLMQEVTHLFTRCGGDDQTSLLCEHFRAADSMYQQNVRLKTGGYGNLLVSRWPIVEKHQISLQLGRKKNRGAQIAVVDTPEGQVAVVNLHLGLAEKERHWQIGHLLGHHLFRALAELPMLIAGDFNDWRNTLSAAALAPQGYTHVTGPPSRFRSFPAYFPLGSLDKAFFRGAVAIREARIVTRPSARWASDHRPLVIDFHLNGAAAEPTA